MRKPLTVLTFLAAWLLMIGLCPAQNSITLWNEEKVITEEDSPFVVEYVYIADDGVLRLEAGAHLVIRPSPDHMNPLLISDGQLIANGTAERPVTIEHEGVYFYPIEIATSDDNPPALQLNHTHWKLGPNNVTISAWENLHPIVIVRNSVIESSYHTSPASSLGGPRAAFELWAESSYHLSFEDTVFLLPNAQAFFADGGWPSIELRRCIIVGGSFDRALPAIDVSIPWGHDVIPKVVLDQCRIAGYESAIRMSGSITYPYLSARIRISDCDLSETSLSVETFSTTYPLEITVKDSHITPMRFWNSYDGLITVDIARCHVTNNVFPTNRAQDTTIHDPVTAPPFRHADINSDGRTGLADLQLLQDVLAGLIEPDDVPDPSALDVDGDGHIDIRDLAVLRAYVDGFLAFLPGDVQP
jgi:hypothetical protein